MRSQFGAEPASSSSSATVVEVAKDWRNRRTIRQATQIVKAELAHSPSAHRVERPCTCRSALSLVLRDQLAEQ
jgi:hypothetical protein